MIFHYFSVSHLTHFVTCSGKSDSVWFLCSFCLHSPLCAPQLSDVRGRIISFWLASRALYILVDASSLWRKDCDYVIRQSSFFGRTKKQSPNAMTDFAVVVASWEILKIPRTSTFLPSLKETHKHTFSNLCMPCSQTGIQVVCTLSVEWAENYPTCLRLTLLLEILKLWYLFLFCFVFLIILVLFLWTWSSNIAFTTRYYLLLLSAISSYYYCCYCCSRSGFLGFPYTGFTWMVYEAYLL